jgi:hypothetical protein
VTEAYLNNLFNGSEKFGEKIVLNIINILYIICLVTYQLVSMSVKIERVIEMGGNSDACERFI